MHLCLCSILSRLPLQVYLFSVSDSTVCTFSHIDIRKSVLPTLTLIINGYTISGVRTVFISYYMYLTCCKIECPCHLRDHSSALDGDHLYVVLVPKSNFHQVAFFDYKS